MRHQHWLIAQKREARALAASAPSGADSESDLGLNKRAAYGISALVDCYLTRSASAAGWPRSVDAPVVWGGPRERGVSKRFVVLICHFAVAP